MAVSKYSDEEIKKSPVFSQIQATFSGLPEKSLIAITRKCLKETSSSSDEGNTPRKKGRVSTKKCLTGGLSTKQIMERASGRRKKEETGLNLIQEKILLQIMESLVDFNEEHGNQDGCRLIISFGKSDGQNGYSITLQNFPTAPRTFSQSQIKMTVDESRASESDDDEDEEESESVPTSDEEILAPS